MIGGGFTGEGLRAESRDMGVEHLPVYGYRGPDLMPPFIRAYPTKLLVRDGRVVARQVGGCGHIPALWAPLLTAELRRTPPRTNP